MKINEMQHLHELVQMETQRVLRVALYVRLSDEDRDKKNITDESESIQNQKNMLIKEAIKRGWEIYDIYVDEDYTGATTNRPNFKRLLKDCEAKKVDIVLCKMQARFTRSMEDLEHIIHDKFLEWGIRFVSIVDNADTSVKGNKKARQIMGLTNEWFLEELSQNIRDTFKTKCEQGQFIGAFAPYGYRKCADDSDKLVVDTEVKDIIVKIYDLYISGMGCRKISKYLNEQNILSPYMHIKQYEKKYFCPGVKNNIVYWSIHSVKRILTNQVYIGNMVQAKCKKVSYKNSKKILTDKSEWIIVENTHEAIIDIDKFNIVQERFGSYARTNYTTGEVQKYSGKIFCSVCGLPYTKNCVTSGNKKVEYLKCSSSKRGHIDCDNTNSIRIDTLDEFMVNEINAILSLYRDNASLLAELNKERLKTKATDISEKTDNLQSESSRIKLKIQKQDLKFKQLYDDKVEQVITEEEFLTLKSIYQEEKNRLVERLNQIDIELSSLGKEQKKTINAEELLSKYERIESMDRNLIEEFIKSISIGKVDKTTKTRKIDVEWTI